MDDASICESINIDLDSLCDTVFPLIFDASLYAIVLGAVCIFEEKSEPMMVNGERVENDQEVLKLRNYK
jgi:hypothetical protein